MIRVSTTRQLLRCALALLLLVCFVGLQTIAATHEHRGADNHCAVCNASHLPVSMAVAVVHVAPPVALIWQRSYEAERHPLRCFCSLLSSRGPPSLSFSI